MKFLSIIERRIGEHIRLENLLDSHVYRLDPQLSGMPASIQSPLVPEKIAFFKSIASTEPRVFSHEKKFSRGFKCSKRGDKTVSRNQREPSKASFTSFRLYKSSLVPYKLFSFLPFDPYLFPGFRLCLFLFTSAGSVLYLFDELSHCWAGYQYL